MRSRSSRRAPAKPKTDESPSSGARFFLILLILAWALRSFIVQPFDIPSGSMLPTLYIGDYLVVAKWPYGYSRYSFAFGFPAFRGRVLAHLPRRGDVVVFRHPTENADLIKRVIGLPGDTVAMSDGMLILNGKPVTRKKLPPFDLPVSANSPCRVVPPALPTTIVRSSRPFCVMPAFLETLPGGPSYTVFDQVDHGPADDFGPVRVPPGHLFLMGDNRDDSLDSRFPTSVGGVGMVPVDHLIGRALVTFWSTDGSASYAKPWTWFTALRANRIGNGYTGEAE
ncbi:MAG TPA: signal peptidase I [Sphingomicrobium sp.]|nr:signal peptidase I [Sphingomicrobium sp.]